jgi:hypothetical protein
MTEPDWLNKSDYSPRPGDDFLAPHPSRGPATSEMVDERVKEAEAARKAKEKQKADLLDKSIVNALREGATADDVATLIGEAELAYAAVREAAELARTQALDPTLPPDEANHWRSEIDDAQFRSDRLHTALGALRGMLPELRTREAEEQQRRQRAYDRLTAERAKLTHEVRRNYPLLASQLADLLTRIAKHNFELDEINHARPNGVERLELIDQHLVDGVTLPRFDTGFDTVEQFPPPQPESMSIFAGKLTVMERLRQAGWPRWQRVYRR